MATKRPVSLSSTFLLPIAAGFFGTLLSMAISAGLGDHEANAAAITQQAKTTPAIASVSPSVTSVATAIVPEKPVQLIIPSIGVNAKVESIGLSKTGNGDLGIPSNFVDVGWYDRGPVPGNPGISIIDGHLDGRYVPKAVFYSLGDLTVGDSIYVKDAAGVIRTFKVVGSETLDYNADTRSLFSNAGTPQLVLITCSGDWMPNAHEYNGRVAVFATLVQ